MKLEFPRKIF